MNKFFFIAALVSMSANAFAEEPATPAAGTQPVAITGAAAECAPAYGPWVSYSPVTYHYQAGKIRRDFLGQRRDARRELSDLRFQQHIELAQLRDDAKYQWWLSRQQLTPVAVYSPYATGHPIADKFRSKGIYAPHEVPVYPATFVPTLAPAAK